MKTVLLLRPDADIDALTRETQRMGLWAQRMTDPDGTRVMTLSAQSRRWSDASLRELPGVAAICRPKSAHPKLDAQAGCPIPITPNLTIGDGSLVLIAGPCAAESASQVEATAQAAAQAGARILRGGAFKPRTSPYSFSGHGSVALDWLRTAADRYDLALVTEVMSETQVQAVAQVADMMQVGSRNMQNFALLAAIGRANRPVMLKRGRAATLAEWRLAAEHLLAAGAAGVVFCERGIQGHDPELRNTLDLAGAAVLKHLDHQPVLVDPSHAAGRADLVIPLTLAAQAIGVDGVMVEVHPDPGTARSDGPQALTPASLLKLGQALGLRHEH